MANGVNDTSGETYFVQMESSDFVCGSLFQCIVSADKVIQGYVLDLEATNLCCHVVPAPWRFVLWALALLLEVGLVLVSGGNLLLTRFDITHLVARVGLFVIIVLGESVISLVTAVDHAWSPAAALVALLGLVLLAALWWSSFDFGSSSVEHALSASHGRSSFALIRDVVAFLHFVAVAAIIVLAAGLGTAVEDAAHGHLLLGALWALAGGQAAYHAAHATIALRYRRPVRQVAVWAVPGVAVPLAVIALHEALSPVAVVAVLATEAVAHLAFARWATAAGRGRLSHTLTRAVVLLAGRRQEPGLQRRIEVDSLGQAGQIDVQGIDHLVDLVQFGELAGEPLTKPISQARRDVAHPDEQRLRFG